MVLSWLRRHRREKLLAQPFPPEWLQRLQKNVAFYATLAPDKQKKLRDDLRIFSAERQWEGCRGLRLTDTIKVTIAAQACLLVLGLEIDLYNRVPSILVYPRGYRVPRTEPLGGGAYLEGEADLLGEAHYRGPVILSWAEVREDALHPGSGRNLVFHEFAHQLDMLNGAADGTPPLESDKHEKSWQRVMTSEFRRLRSDAERGRRTLLDPYGLTNEAEFFAVATEAFFDCAAAVQEQHPKLYRLFCEYYRQDPAQRAGAM
jgi:Mlc titration factor MtfA (ptsG expression regulator)